MSWPIKACLELGALSFAAFLWLTQIRSFASWWQLASIWAVWTVFVIFLNKRKLPVDGLVCCGLLLMIGWLFIFRIDPVLALNQWRGILLGFIGFSACLLVNWHDFKYKYISGSAALLLLLVTLIFGETAGGAKAWLQIGSIRFQPVETVRILLLLFLAGYFYDYEELLRLNRRWPQLKYWGPLLVLMAGVFLFLAVQRDLGPALLFFGLFVTLALYINFNWYLVLIYLLAAGGGVVLAWFGFPHIRRRFLVWVDPWVDSTGAGYQIVLGLFAVHNGGLFGRGLGFGLGTDLPAVHTDYIFALISEELGLIGTVVILLIYLLLLFFGLKSAKKLKGRSHILAIGIVLIWGYQVFIVSGGILKVIPLSGMTLPFISYGTTSLIANMCLLGILTKLGSGSDPKQDEGKLREKRNPRLVLNLTVLLFAVLLSGLIYWQVLRPDLDNHPQNPKGLMVFKTERGTIYDRNGTALVSTDSETLRRIYHGHPSLVHLIGYFHPRYGITGLESAYNRQLSSRQDLYLTVDAELQALIDGLFKPHQGAVVAINPQTGEVLALYAAPYIDPNQLDQAWEQFQKDPHSPFFNRAVSGAYPPGSSIKPLWLAAAYQTKAAAPEQFWQDQGLIEFGEQSIQNFNRRSFGSITTQQALSLSSNTVFAELAVLLKAEGLEYLRMFGLGTAPGNLPEPQLSDYGWAQLGIGQGSIAVSPLQMAAAIGAIANRGMGMEPYWVGSLTGSWLTRRIYRPRVKSQVITGLTAGLLRDAMVECVNSGTGQAARIPGITVAGKTGTAENPHGQDHSWFVGFAPADYPEIAVAVVVEHGGQGGGLAAQIAREVMAAWLNRL